MSDSLDDVSQQLIDGIAALDVTSDEAATAIKSLKTYAEAKKLLEPEPIPVPEPTGFFAAVSRHAGDLIKVGGTLTAVVVIAVIEAKGDVIFRSKASKYL